jgi:hypothetical protein
VEEPARGQACLRCSASHLELQGDPRRSGEAAARVRWPLGRLAQCANPVSAGEKRCWIGLTAPTGVLVLLTRVARARSLTGCGVRRRGSARVDCWSAWLMQKSAAWGETSGVRPERRSAFAGIELAPAPPPRESRAPRSDRSRRSAPRAGPVAQVAVAVGQSLDDEPDSP